ncbi:hypothetical protein [Saccharothrix coeruleofusca]|uniref:Uncharacterized protein n=1 Tax=Saccharothrix coeruleofusca TaxID=33919 RepID=A0A918AIE1_9PSEU|nr:hypothetical protein [Saccharothrix coeruleofusca]MBP2340257.1 hypothetical protein [Saccharothrix coeruleofusca]GGP36475.1 hypothetical protein GCM10010185_04490 [Saccharothrix coeruleofusca]
MNGFSVDPRELLDAAKRVRAEVDDLVREPALKYRVAPDQVGHDGLGAALAAFHETCAAGATTLVEDALELIRRLEATAAVYTGADEDLADLLRAPR